MLVVSSLTQMFHVPKSKELATQYELYAMNPENNDRNHHRHPHHHPLGLDERPDHTRGDASNGNSDNIAALLSSEASTIPHHPPSNVNDTRLPAPLRPHLHSDDGSSSIRSAHKQESTSHGDTKAPPKVSTNTSREPSASNLAKEAPAQRSFPQKLMQLLEEDQYSDIVEWLPNGKGFRIHDTTRFEREVMPVCFGQRAKFASFARRLNRWGFSRTSRGEYVGVYFHPKFVRGEHKLCQEITPGSPGSERKKQVDHIDPAVAWNMATPAMWHHGLVDNGMPTLDLSSDPFQPTPIHPRLDRKAMSAFPQQLQAHQQPAAVAKTDTTRIVDTEPHMLQQQMQLLQHDTMQHLLQSQKQDFVPQQQQQKASHLTMPRDTTITPQQDLPSLSNAVTQAMALNSGIANFDHAAVSTPAPPLSTVSLPLHTAEPVSSTTNSSFSDVLQSFARSNATHQASLNDDLLDAYLQQFRDEHQQTGKDT